MSSWTSCWRLQLNTFDFRSLLAVECGALGATVKAPNISHDSVERGVFAGRPFVLEG